MWVNITGPWLDAEKEAGDLPVLRPGKGISIQNTQRDCHVKLILAVDSEEACKQNVKVLPKLLKAADRKNRPQT